MLMPASMSVCNHLCLLTVASMPAATFKPYNAKLYLVGYHCNGKKGQFECIVILFIIIIGIN